ncbi:MAG: hypothetical protein ABIK09_18295, partial [Pseudomonadota bacterium]
PGGVQVNRSERLPEIPQPSTLTSPKAASDTEPGGVKHGWSVLSTMPRKKHHKTEPPRLMKVRDRDIPDWFREIPCPSENDLATCLTNLRWDFSPFVALKTHTGLSPESDEPSETQGQASPNDI